MQKIRGDITIESGAGEHQGMVYVYQIFKLPEIEGHPAQTVSAGWSIGDFEQYLADSYRLLKELKLKMAQHEQAKKERSNSRAVSDKSAQAESDESQGDRGQQLSETSELNQECLLDAPNSAYPDQQGSDSAGGQSTPESFP